jgi:hypothetical protein
MQINDIECNLEPVTEHITRADDDLNHAAELPCWLARCR